MHGKRHTVSGFPQWDLSQLRGDSLEALQNSISVQVTPKAFDLILPKPRPKRDAVWSFQLPQ